MEEGSYEWKPIRRERFILRTRLNAGFGGGYLLFREGEGFSGWEKGKTTHPSNQKRDEEE